MKLGIMTLPLHSNYGGILQNYALQQVLQALGHEPITLDVPLPPDRKRHVRTAEEQAVYLRRTEAVRAFADSRIRRTERLSCPLDYAQIQTLGLDGYVIGSDQIWQPSLSKRDFLKAMFLGFLPKADTARRVVYAASFGPAKWTLGRKLLFRLVLARYADRFHGISVREDAGADFCRRYLGRPADVVLDPVMLMTGEEWSENLGLSDAPAGHVMNYVLDASEAKQTCRARILSHLGGGLRELVMGSYESTTGLMPAMETWLEGFKNAEFVITDSFHGAVLSILFGRPFVVFGNVKRGIDRFYTLLRPLGLERRLLFPTDGVYEYPAEVFETEDIRNAQTRLAARRERSTAFLRDALAGRSSGTRK